MGCCGRETEAGAGEIPIGASARAEMAVDDYFDEFHPSETTLNRRVSRVSETGGDGAGGCVSARTPGDGVVELGRPWPHCGEPESAEGLG